MRKIKLIIDDEKTYIYNTDSGIMYEVSAKDNMGISLEDILVYGGIEEKPVNSNCKKIPVVSPYMIWNKKFCIYLNWTNQIIQEIISEEEEIILNEILTLGSDVNNTTFGMESCERIICDSTSFEKQKIKWIPIDDVHESEKYFYLRERGYRSAINTKDNSENKEYYQNIKKGNEEKQFRQIETTISYMFRNKSDILGGKKYGEVIAERVLPHFEKTEISVMEVGGGLGDLAKAFVDSREAKGIVSKYVFCDISEALLNKQREKMKESDVDCDYYLVEHILNS